MKKVFTLGILYFVQGLPYGFQDKFIPTYLRSSGLSHTKLSLMKLLLFPWVCKAAFAPIVDLFWTKWLWLLSSLCGLTIISLAGTLLSPEYFVAVLVWLFALNLFSAFQDIAVDGLALKILQDNEMGHANTAQVLGYKLGALSGGGVLFWIHLYYGWSGLCISLATLYLMSIAMFLPLYKSNDDSGNIYSTSHNLDRPSPSESDSASKAPSDDSDTTVIGQTETHGVVQRVVHTVKEISPIENVNPESKVEEKIIEKRKTNLFHILPTVFRTNGTLPLVVFLFFYKLGERGALSTFPLFMIDRGVTMKELGLWSGIIGQTSSLFGSVCGGYLISRQWKVGFLLHYACLIRSVPIFLQWVIVNLWNSDVSSLFHQILFCCSVTSLVSLEFIAGMMTTAVFTLMMACSLKAPSSVQSTHYSVLSSVEVAGKLVFASTAGALIDWIGISLVYAMLTFLSIISVFIIPHLE